MDNGFLMLAIESNRPIYCAVRLFSPQDRIAGANLAGAIELKFKELTNDAWKFVFLPYRDTNQANIIGNDRAKKIYKLDIDTLRNSSALMARFDGLAKDSGISMEIGYAYGINIPIGILVTDFIWEGNDLNDIEWEIDPIIHLMSDCVVSVPRFGMIHSSYYHSNIEHEHHAVQEFIDRCIDTFSNKHSPPNCENNNLGVYIDFMGGRYEWSMHETQYIMAALNAELSIPVKTACRYIESKAESVRDLALLDINSLLHSTIAVFSGDAPELDAGSAALLGLARSKGIFIIFQYTSNIVYKGVGSQRMKINLMLEYAADMITRSTDETIEAIRARLPGDKS